MSLKASSIAYRASPRDAVAKLVLIGLADYADEYGCVAIDVADLSRFAMTTPGAVEKALSALAEDLHIRLYTADDGKRVASIVGAAL